MIDFGMPTLLKTKTIEDCAKLCQALCLRFIELNMNLPQYQADRIDIHQLSEIAGRYGLYYTIHLDENLNPADFNQKVAGAYRRTVYDAIAVAEKLGCPVLNMHLAAGVHFTMPDRKIYLFDEYRDEYLRRMAAFRDACARRIGGADIKICVENTDGYDKDFLREGLDVLLESPVFTLTFDIGHDHSIGNIDEPVIMTRAEKLRHMHMHDAKRTAATKANHLPLGEGEINLAKYLKLAEDQNCRVVLETKTVTGLTRSVAWLRENYGGYQNEK